MTSTTTQRASTDRVSFENSRGLSLVGLLERPAQAPRFFALVAHCFTCTKDFPAVARISRALAQVGIAVLRFDMTGLGASAGDFSSSNFSTAIDDLQSAAAFLARHETAPTLLIGHSWGGATCLATAQQLPGVSAIATIAAPSDPAHVLEHFPREVERALEVGAAPIAIAGRSYELTRQFIEDVRSHDHTATLRSLNRPLLILHSPSDSTVDIAHAQRIYETVRGTRSFIALPNADHVLSERRHTDYTATMIDAWFKGYC
ncbi:MAG: pimeloyl-ACP methyl ester carboxylesterase [Chlamydiales bacterium]